MSDDLEERRYAMDRTSKDRHNLISGCVLLAVGAWAAIAPFAVGDWEWGTTSGSFLLTIVPGAAAALGGLVMLGGRRFVSVGGTLALLGGLWFVAAPLLYALFVGPDIAMLQSGEPVHLLRWIVFFFGAGAVVSFLGSYSLGLVVPLEFEDEVASQTTTATTRARVPLPAERPRRKRGVSEPSPQPADHARGKRSAPRES